MRRHHYLTAPGSAPWRRPMPPAAMLLVLLAPVLLAMPLPAAAQKAPEQAADTTAATAGDAALKQAEGALAAANKLPKGSALLRALGKAAARRDKRRKVETLSTDAMDRLGDLARAQEQLCKSIQPAAPDAKANQGRAQLLAAMGDRMRELVTGTLAPLWSQLPMKALRAGQLDFGAVHARFDAGVLAQQRAVAACKGKLTSAPAPTPDELRKAYDDAFEAGVTHALTQHKRLARAEEDLNLALRGYHDKRRPAVEARLRAAITKLVK